tara:strand:- start:1154 stop:1609 length:456 start_codon:yes stop_codon:yes gene_type:complete
VSVILLDSPISKKALAIFSIAILKAAVLRLGTSSFARWISRMFWLRGTHGVVQPTANQIQFVRPIREFLPKSLRDRFADRVLNGVDGVLTANLFVQTVQPAKPDVGEIFDPLEVGDGDTPRTQELIGKDNGASFPAPLLACPPTHPSSSPA